MTNNTFTFDDALTAISDYALALRSDSDASDSTLDELQLDLDLMLDHDAYADDDDYELLHPDFSTFPSAAYADLNPALSATTAAHELASLRRAANALFNTRP